MPIGDRTGPRIEIKVFCGGCKFLDTEKSYGSNDYEEIDYVCDARRNEHGRRPTVPGGETPDWCPYYPKTLPTVEP